ncbi:MAG: hypothetical protein FWD62_08785 [Betaproteobacteria bacterium]|nr:hypothetical protein [Betaproteobacteria bacterium]
MQDHNPIPDASTDNNLSGAKQELALSAARRRWILRGGAAAPVILTLASRPVLGVQCQSPSAALSGNLSQAGSAPSCTGQSVSYWQGGGGIQALDAPLTPSSAPATPAAPTWWPLSADAYFHSYFAQGAKGSGCYFMTADNNYLTLYNVMCLSTSPDSSGNFDKEKVAASFIAALLNITKGSVPAKVMTAATLQNMWKEWAVNGSYTPFAGAAPWNGTAIKNYLANNGIAPTP